MFLRKAMRYYRLWIYTCNAVLFTAVVVLVVVASHTASHPYIPLLPGPPAYDPTYIYAYIAMFLQAGVVQVLGCVGALKLSQKLLNLYWLLLVALLLGDIVVGLVWFLRFPIISVQISSSMSSTLYNYHFDEPITSGWDDLQKAEECCGVRSPEDYTTTRWGHSKRYLPDSCCVLGGAMAVQADQAARHIPHPHTVQRSERPARNRSFTCFRTDYRPYRNGCEEALRNWMHSSTESLMILGFCVITFIKFCFVGILRFEIQEMIEKIKILQGESSNTPNPEMAAALGLVLPGPQGDMDLLGDESQTDERSRETEIRNNENERGNIRGGIQERALQTNLPGNGSTLIGIREERHYKNTEPMDSSMSPLAIMRANLLLGATTDPGGDSDTNSHSALITDTPVHKPLFPDKHRHNGNNNDLTTSLPTVTTANTTLTTSSEMPLHGLFHVKQTQI